MPSTKMTSKWIKNLTVRPETIKLLGLGDDFLNMTSKVKATEAKINTSN